MLSLRGSRCMPYLRAAACTTLTDANHGAVVATRVNIEPEKIGSGPLPEWLPAGDVAPN